MYAQNPRKVVQINQRRYGVSGQLELLIVREGSTAPTWESKLHDIPSDFLDEINKHFEMEESRGKKTQDYTPFNYSEYAKPIFTTNKNGRRGIQHLQKNQRELQNAQSKRLNYEEQVTLGKIKNFSGSLDEGDVIQRFKRLRRYQDSNKRNVLEFWVEWKPRKDGTKPEDSIISNDELRGKAPDTLIDFYESILDFESEETQDEDIVRGAGEKENLSYVNSTKSQPSEANREPTSGLKKTCIDEERDTDISGSLAALYGNAVTPTDPYKSNLDIHVMNRKLSEGVDRSDFTSSATTATKGYAGETVALNNARSQGNYISESSESQSN